MHVLLLHVLHAYTVQHHSDIWAKKIEKPVAAHFSQPNHSLEDLEVSGIEKIREDGTMQWIRQRESYWIIQLKTLDLNRINVDE